LYLAARILLADDNDKHGLDDVAERLLGFTPDKRFQKYDWKKPLTDAHYQYSALDAEIPPRLHSLLIDKIKQQDRQYILSLEHRVLPLFLQMWRKGMYLDWNRWGALLAASAQRRDSFEQVLQEELPKYLSMEEVDRTLVEIKKRQPGELVNWGADGQLKRILHRLGVKVDNVKWTTLEAAVDQHLIMPTVLAFRRERTRHNQLEERLQYRGPDDRIHACWKQSGTRTGRTSCVSPNLQNVPNNETIRGCYIPEPGNVLLGMDFSQVEPRVLAAITGDERLLEAFRQGQDLYCWIAAELLEKPIAEIDPNGWERKWGKQTLLATMYGQSASSLAASMSKAAGRSVSESEAATHLDKFYRLFSKVAEWSRQQRALQRRGGFVKTKAGKVYREDYGETTTIRGRKRIVRAPDWKAARELLNTPIQGSAADAAKETLAILYETQADSGGAELTNFIHDEYIAECPDHPENIAAAKKWYLNGAVQGLKSVLGDVPLGITEADIVVAYQWPKKKDPERLIDDDSDDDTDDIKEGLE
jgi:DNA polymerase I